MQMEAGLDTGPVLLREAMPIGGEVTTGALHDALSAMGARMIVATLDGLDDLIPEPQPADGVTYAEKIDKAETRIDWTKPAHEVSRHIRGLSPFPGAWCMVGDERVKLLGARVVPGDAEPGTALGGFTIACDAGAVEITRAQRAGKRAMTAQDILQGWEMPAKID